MQIQTNTAQIQGPYWVRMWGYGWWGGKLR